MTELKHPKRKLNDAFEINPTEGIKVKQMRSSQMDPTVKYLQDLPISNQIFLCSFEFRNSDSNGITQFEYQWNQMSKQAQVQKEILEIATFFKFDLKDVLLAFSLQETRIQNSSFITQGKLNSYMKVLRKGTQHFVLTLMHLNPQLAIRFHQHSPHGLTATDLANFYRILSNKMNKNKFKSP